MRGREELEQVATSIVDAIYHVHRALGPGLLESAYQKCLVHELQHRRLEVQREVVLPVCYLGLRVETGFRIDMLIEGIIIVENKSVKAILPVHQSQLLTYLKLADVRLGFLVNWNVHRIKEGLRRMAYNL